MDGLRVVIKPIGDTNGEIAKNSGRLTPSQMMSVAEAGAEIVRTAIATQVITKRKSNPGIGLAESVHYTLGAGATGAVAKMGWKGRSIGKKAGKYKDGRGRTRKAYTTADIGGILEYSAKRQLRHMGPGYDESENDALIEEITGS